MKKNLKRQREFYQAICSSNLLKIQQILDETRSIQRDINDLNFQDTDEMSSVHQAAFNGNVEILKLLIDNGMHMNLKDGKGLSPLHYASCQGQTESVYILLRHGAQVNEQSIDGDTPLHFASQLGHEEIVQLLLYHHADPTICNHQFLTPIDLACEHGFFQLVHLLIHHPLGHQYILKNQFQQHTPLHLAAKNGHTDIVRLLLLNGIDINRLTIHDGSALHVAARNGRYETAKLLLECGIDLNLCNSFEQTALDVVIKQQKTGNDIQRLIKEFSQAILVQAIRSYSNYRVGALNFTKGDCITVLERKSNGPWRGFILQEDLTTRSGYFPSIYVRLCTNVNNYANHGHRDQENDFSLDNRSMTMSSSSLNWQTSRSNPYRYSTTSSIDSGRSSTTLYDSPKTMTLSSFSPISSYDSKISDMDKNSCRSSNSSFDESTSLHVNTLLQHGLPANDIVFIWLREFSFEHYAENFLNHGYDIQTIVRMTPEDLTAIGITHPLHRRRIKNEIARLHLPDVLPDFKPETLAEWLSYLNLDEYLSRLNEQNYKNLSDIKQIVWEDLEEIGITRLGHQKRFMLGVKRLIDIDKGLFPLRISSMKSSLARWNSLENHQILPKSSHYATFRKSHRPSMTIGSFRLPPPLSIQQSSNKNQSSRNSNRTRSLENLNVQGNQIEANEIYSTKKTSSTIRNDRRNVLSDIDTMLSELNRELDQMLDYEVNASETNNFVRL